MIESACAHRFSPIDASMRLISILHYFDCCSTKNEFFSIKCLYFFGILKIIIYFCGRMLDDKIVLL